MPLPETPTLSVERLLETERIVGYRPCFASAFGGVACAVLLSQFWFWTNTPTVRARGGWFWKCQREITEETGLSRHEIETARRRLRILGVLQEERHGIPPIMHFRLDTQAMARYLARQASNEIQFAEFRQNNSPESGNTICRISANKCSIIRQFTTETTTETTQEKTQTPEGVPAAFEIPEKQQKINRNGAARFKAALDAAARQSRPRTLG